jgi:excisionase family DNA binding protein
MATIPPASWLTPKQAAEFLGISPWTLRDLIRAGRIAVNRLSPRVVRIPSAEVDKLLVTRATWRKRAAAANAWGLTPQAAAHVLGVSVGTVRGLIRSGKLASRDFGTGIGHRIAPTLLSRLVRS